MIPLFVVNDKVIEAKIEMLFYPERTRPSRTTSGSRWVARVSHRIRDNNFICLKGLLKENPIQAYSMFSSGI